MTFTRALSTNNYGTAKFIVDGTNVASGTHSTITAALASASANDTIFIRPGTYTENFTWPTGINLAAYDCDALTPNVTIVGKATCTDAGARSASGIRFQTNSDFFLVVSGSANTVVNLTNCYLNCSNNTGISFTTSGASSRISLLNCEGDIGTTGIALYTKSSTTLLLFEGGRYTNTGASTTASSNSAGVVAFTLCEINSPVATSGTGVIAADKITIDTSPTNTVCITTAGSGSGNLIKSTRLISGSASSISIGAGTIAVVTLCDINSTNTNAIDGLGSIAYQGLSFTNNSQKISTTTQSGGLLPGGVAQAPTVGFIGEQIRSFIDEASEVSVATNTGTNITSISLTAGIWDVSGIVVFGDDAITGTYFAGAVSGVSASLQADGDNTIITPVPPTVAASVGLSIPSYRVTLTSTTTYYLVAYATYTVGTLTAYGRISATRVG